MLTLLTKRELSERWKVTSKTIDLMRKKGLLPWVGLGPRQGPGTRPRVRFRLSDVEAVEAQMRRCAE